MAETKDPANPAEAPKERTLDDILENPQWATAASSVRDAIVSAKEFAGETTLVVKRKRIREVCQAMKADGYDYLVDLTGVDYSKYPGHTAERFAVVYQLYSFSKNVRLRLKTFVPDGLRVPSVTSVWKTANWHERETYDMFGVEFEGHPNLERILMWEGFNGYPLRKDFPLRGIETGSRIYPEVFAPGQGPREGSTGKDPADVNMYKEDWTQFGRSPAAAPPPSKKKPLPPASEE